MLANVLQTLPFSYESNSKIRIAFKISCEIFASITNDLTNLANANESPCESCECLKNP